MRSGKPYRPKPQVRIFHTFARRNFHGLFSAMRLPLPAYLQKNIDMPRTIIERPRCLLG